MKEGRETVVKFCRDCDTSEKRENRKTEMCVGKWSRRLILTQAMHIVMLTTYS